ncbi:MAG: DNA adenine methylase [Acidobacteriota bacterium]|nr:DNA adenine methylase [Acidobacteriota bacterium]
MPTTYTPLRYPGGKAKLGPFLADVLRHNHLTDGTYAEPYAGGAGAALFLLLRGYVRKIHINDIDPAVAAFWRAVTRHTNKFVRAIETAPLTIAEWKHQRSIYREATAGFELGFAFFYLNRTNRSGIMNAGVIGGQKQKGRWLINARFNRDELTARVRAIGAQKRLISISQVDALSFVSELDDHFTRGERSFLYLDPPYFNKGQDLYTNWYSREDHAAIARTLSRLRTPWLLTYDDCDEIRSLYADFHVRESELSYSAREVRRGKELVVFGPGLRTPTTVREATRHEPGFQLGRRVAPYRKGID